jgi:hypothetical protein
MNHNNRKWYTIFTKDTITGEYEVFAHVKGEGNAYLLVSALRPYYGESLRSLEGKYNEMTDQLKAKYFYC